MSLKRKASFPSITSPQSAQGYISLPSMDDSPRHLHCRTRKRVRNDRPDDQTVYQNTLQLLFRAQQQVQQVPTRPASQDEDMEPDTPTPAVDCRQQTLLQFFRPAQTSRQPCPSTPISQFSSEVLQGGNVFPQGHGFCGASPLTSNDGDAMTPAPQSVDRDMDIDMDTGSNESSPAPWQWTGPVGWM